MMSASGDLARSVADMHARRTGWVLFGGRAYENSFAEGKTYRVVICAVCSDTGIILGDHDEFLGHCDCATGEAQSGGAA